MSPSSGRICVLLSARFSPRCWLHLFFSESGSTPNDQRSSWRRRVRPSDPQGARIPPTTLEDGQTLSSLKIYASGQRVVVWDGTSRWQPDFGQFLLNFGTTPLLKTKQLKRHGGQSAYQPARRWPGSDGRGDCRYESVEEARQAYQEAIRLRPACVEAHANLGLLNHNMGERKEAEACYRRALRYAPNPGSAHFKLGGVLEDQEEKEEAIYASEEALRRNLV